MKPRADAEQPVMLEHRAEPRDTFSRKLIRDRVPDLALRGGVKLHVRPAALNERRILAARKVLEEAAEFEAVPSLEELADLAEAVLLAIEAYGWSAAELEAQRLRKQASNGGFARWLVLDSTPLPGGQEGE